MVCMSPQVFAFCVILSALASGIVVASQRIHSFAREKLRHLLEPYRVHKPHLGHRSASRLLDRDAEGPLIVEVCVCVVGDEARAGQIATPPCHPTRLKCLIGSLAHGWGAISPTLTHLYSCARWPYF